MHATLVVPGCELEFEICLGAPPQLWRVERVKDRDDSTDYARLILRHA